MFTRAQAIPGLVVLACAALAGCNMFSSPSQPPPPPVPTPMPSSAPPPSAPPPPVAAPSGPATSGTCSLQGQWSGRINPGPTPFANSPVTADYRADHTIEWGTDLARFRGTWQVEGTTFHVTDTWSSIPPAACPSAVIGNYTLEWTPDCNGVTFRLTADECEGRRPALKDLRLTRSSS